MSPEPYQKAGRGGAGNFFSSKGQKSEDNHEAVQPQQTGNPSTPQPSTVRNPWARSGRGGAGNFYSAADAPSEEDAEEASRLAAAKSTKPRLASGLVIGGRGGAGNWIGGGADNEDADDDDKARKEEVDSKVARDVEACLPVPPRIYSSSQGGDGQGPEGTEDV